MTIIIYNFLAGVGFATLAFLFIIAWVAILDKFFPGIMKHINSNNPSN